MNSTDSPYLTDYAAAFVRGTVLRGALFPLKPELVHEPFELLSEEDKTTIIAVGIQEGLRLHRFKRLHVLMPRVRRTLGFLQGVLPESLLDIGSGRGAFLWSCLDAFPELPVTAMDIESHRAELYETVRVGGIGRLHGIVGDIRTHDFAEQTFDVVTMLEVLEHIEYPGKALENVRRIARRHVVITVPSKEDDNPEHLHLFTQESFYAVKCFLESK
ncbi:MAG: class I SAM-dependent methyltransferase [Planctomycetaceae bacterium]|nr:class I SAM-dependent methyltransferase [Planctomycetaceae bacterium]